MTTIAELVEDRTVDGVYAVARKRRLSTRDGKPYLAVELVDPSGRIEGRVWDDVELLDRRFAEGDAVRVLGRVERFDGRLQVQVRTVEAADVDPAQLTPAMRRDADELDGFLDFLAAEIAHPQLAGLVREVLGDREVRDGMRLLPAAGRDGHHGYAGGLLEHTVGVATLCRETGAAPSAAPRRPASRRSAAPRRRVASVSSSAGRRSVRRGRARSSAMFSSVCGSWTSGPRPSSRPCAPSSCTRSRPTTTAVRARTAEAAVLYHANQLDAQAATRSVGDD